MNGFSRKHAYASLTKKSVTQSIRSTDRLKKIT